MEENEGIDGLGTALDVKGQGLIVVVSWRSVWKKESLLPVLISTHQLPVEPIITSALLVPLEAVQNVSRVKVVNPVMIFLLGVVPG